MIDYRAGNWGFHVAWTHCINGSLVPKALTMALPNALITFIIASLIQKEGADDFESGIITIFHADTSTAATIVMAAFTAIMTFILQRRSSIAYDRWWEGGTLLQKTRGEWFNAYSSIMAFTSTKPELQPQVESYVHLLARLMSLLMCCGLQQVSPNRDRVFEIVDLQGIEPESMDFLNSAPDKVEIILQWIQRSMVDHAQTGVLPVAPPILSRAFQEYSRGIVNLQNARKIADFPYPYPLAQISMVLQILHWAAMPLAASLAVPRGWAVLLSFFSIFGLWCIHFNAIELEFPFGSRANDLPMVELQQDWNESIITLLDRRATRAPHFDYIPDEHNHLPMAMSDASTFTIPKIPKRPKGNPSIRISRANVANRQKICKQPPEYSMSRDTLAGEPESKQTPVAAADAEGAAKNSKPDQRTQVTQPKDEQIVQNQGAGTPVRDERPPHRQERSDARPPHRQQRSDAIAAVPAETTHSSGIDEIEREAKPSDVPVGSSIAMLPYDITCATQGRAPSSYAIRLPIKQAHTEGAG